MNKASKETNGGVFPIQTGVAIAFCVHENRPTNEETKIQYIDMSRGTKREKLKWLDNHKFKKWQHGKSIVIHPNSHNEWVNQRPSALGQNLPRIIQKQSKEQLKLSTIFKAKSVGINTARDHWGYG